MLLCVPLVKISRHEEEKYFAATSSVLREDSERLRGAWGESVLLSLFPLPSHSLSRPLATPSAPNFLVTPQGFVQKLKVKTSRHLPWLNCPLYLTWYVQGPNLLRNRIEVNTVVLQYARKMLQPPLDAVRPRFRRIRRDLWVFAMLYWHPISPHSPK